MKNGEAPQHLISWAPSDWLTSRVRARSAMTGDYLLRTVYFELLNVLYANGGEVPANPEALSDLLLLPPDEIEKRLPVLLNIGSILIEDNMVRQPRVSKELKRYDSLTEKRRQAARVRWDSDSDASALQTDANALQVQSGAMHGAMAMAMAKATAREKEEGNPMAVEVYDYWRDTTKSSVRSKRVEQSILARILLRLKDGFSVSDLKRCVDVARHDDFYIEKGYYRQPDVIFRNAERVQSLLARIATAKARPLPL